MVRVVVVITLGTMLVIGSASSIFVGDTNYVFEDFDSYDNKTDLEENWNITKEESPWTIEIDNSTSISEPNSLHVFGDQDVDGGDVRIDTRHTVELENGVTNITWNQKTFLDGGADGRAGIQLNNGSGGYLRTYLRTKDISGEDGWWIAGSVVTDTNNPDTGSGVTINDPWRDMRLEINRTSDKVTLYRDGSEILNTTLDSDIKTVTLQFYLHHRHKTIGDSDVSHIYYDDFEFNGDRSRVSGFVKDKDGNPIQGATVSANNSTVTDETNPDGSYTLLLEDGTYEITATADDFRSNSTTVTVSGSDLTNQNITLLEDKLLALDVPDFMWHNQTLPYVVTFGSDDVTANATVNSSDSTNLTVDTTNHELESTSDTSVNKEITISAEYQGVTVEKNVTVANLTVENMDIMQNGARRFSALWGDVQNPNTGERPGGTQLTMRVIFVALLAGIAATFWASSFAGIGAMTLVMVIGWFQGWVGEGMVLVTVFAGLFIGLNLAANIDYQVRK